MNNKVENPKTEVPNTPELNDYDYLFDLLSTEKCISNNLATALSEASCDNLYNKIYAMFSDTKLAGRELFDLAFQNGWYPLEHAEENKIQEKITEFSSKINELV